MPGPAAATVAVARRARLGHARLQTAPVPYVFLASDTAQRWPIMAACWSPRQPAMGTPCRGPSVLMVLRAGQGARRRRAMEGLGYACSRVETCAQACRRLSGWVGRLGAEAAGATRSRPRPDGGRQAGVAAARGGAASPVHLSVAADLRQHGRRHAKQAQCLLVPVQLAQVHQVSA